MRLNLKNDSHAFGMFCMASSYIEAVITSLPLGLQSIKASRSEIPIFANVQEVSRTA